MKDGQQPSDDFITQRLKLFKKQAKKYIERRIELAVLESSEQVSHIFANLAHQVSGLIILLVGLVFLLIASALFIGDILQQPSIGFVIVSVPLFIIGSIFMGMRPQALTVKIRDVFLKEMVRISELKELPDNPGRGRDPASHSDEETSGQSKEDSPDST